MASERWVVVKDNGELFLHTENDGWAYMRNGPQATNEPVSLKELKKYSYTRGQISRTLYDDAVDELKTKGFPIPQD